MRALGSGTSHFGGVVKSAATQQEEALPHRMAPTRAAHPTSSGPVYRIDHCRHGAIAVGSGNFAPKQPRGCPCASVGLSTTLERVSGDVGFSSAHGS